MLIFNPVLFIYLFFFSIAETHSSERHAARPQLASAEADH
jgi:hypothetical protein